MVSRILPICLALAALPAAGRPDDKKDDKAKPLFNGKDLAGWVNANCAPGTFFVKGDEVVTTGKPTGFLRTDKQYENFVAEFEWMHVNTKEVGNSGFFVWADPLPAVGTPYTRGIEVQVLVNLEKPGFYTSHGDLFSIWGATCRPDRPHPNGWSRCLPSENHCKGGGEWNRYKVVANDGSIKLHVNGKEVSGVSACKPRKGYLALESEGAECHFRNLKIEELPTTNPKADEIAEEAKGHVNLFTGLDLAGWKADDEAKKHWTPRDWGLRFDGKGEALPTEAKYGAAEFVADFRFPTAKDGGASFCQFAFAGRPDAAVRLSVARDGKVKAGAGGATHEGAFEGLKPAGEWNRLRAALAGDTLTATINGREAATFKDEAVRGEGRFQLSADGAMEFGNLFVREDKKK